MFRRIIGILALVAMAIPGIAANIVTTSPAGSTCCSISPAAEYQAWTQSVTYTGVTITANLFDGTPGAAATGTAYLTTQVGPGTTTAWSRSATPDRLRQDLARWDGQCRRMPLRRRRKH